MAAIVAVLTLGFSWFSLTSRRVDIEPRLVVARQARQTAQTLLESHRGDDAEQACRQAIESLDELADNASRDVSYRRERAAVLDTLGQILVQLQLPAEAVPYLNEAISLRANLVAEVPTASIDRAPLASCLLRLGQLYRDAGCWEEAETVLRRGVRFCESIFGRTGSDSDLIRERIAFLDLLGQLYADAERRPESIEYLKNAVAAQKHLVGTSANMAEDRERLVTLSLHLAIADRRPLACEQILDEALGVADKLRLDFPSNEHYSSLVITVLDQLATLLKSDRARRIEVRDLLGRIVAIREQLVAIRPQSPEELANLADAYDSMADFCREWKSLDQAEAVYRKELACHAQLVTDHPAAAHYRFGHGRVLHNLADLLRERHRPTESLVLEQQAVEQLRGLYAENIKDPDRRRAFSYACWALCELLLETKEPLRGGLGRLGIPDD